MGNSGEDVRPLLLFGTPRSGSSLYYHILSSYLAQTEGVEGLDEYFNVFFHSFWDSGNGIERSVHPSKLLLDKKGCKDLISSVTSHRCDLLKKYHGRYFFKFFGTELNSEELSWLFAHYDWIFVERRNLFEQMLSFLISTKTEIWYREEGIQLARRSVVADVDVMYHFQNLIWMYLQTKRLIQPRATFYLEDFSGPEDLRRLLTRAGFERPIDYSSVWLPPQQNKGDKLEVFKNPELIHLFYQKSWLNRVCPLSPAVETKLMKLSRLTLSPTLSLA